MDISRKNYRTADDPRDCYLHIFKYFNIISKTRNVGGIFDVHENQVIIMRSIRKNEDAFTGLEAAIVLIAFVVVAAVFSYVVLGAGFFTTQKSQETVHSGVAMASSAVEILGDVYGTAGTPATGVDTINFTIGLAAGATSVDMSKAVFTFSTSTVLETLTADQDSAGGWTIVAVNHELGTPNKMLEAGEQFEISAQPTNPMIAYTAFNLEIKPPIGASLAIKRTIPANINAVNLLF